MSCAATYGDGLGLALLQLRTLACVVVTGVGMHMFLVTVQQALRLALAGLVRRCGGDRKDHSGVRNHSDMRFHAETQIVLIRLTHVQVTLPLLVLRRRWHSDQVCIDVGALAEDQSLLTELVADQRENTYRHLVRHQQAAELH